MALVGRHLFTTSVSASFRIINQIAVRRSIAMSSVRRQTDEAVEKLKSANPYYDKYAAKLAALQAKAPEEFLDKVNKVVKPAVASKKPIEEKPR